jgi:hypothetical protein
LRTPRAKDVETVSRLVDEMDERVRSLLAEFVVPVAQAGADTARQVSAYINAEQGIPFGYRTVRCAAGPVPERKRDRRVAGKTVRPSAGSRAEL